MSKAITYLFYALFLFTPLILWPQTSEVFEFNKMLFVYVVTLLVSAAWLTNSINQKKFIFRRTPLDLPLLLFLASQILSTIFSIDTHTSLWGYYSRFHGGLMSTISYIILYYAFVTNIKISNIKYQISNILLSATLVSLYGVLEHFGIDKNFWVQDVQNRVFSTLGQPNWLSAYLVAILPIPIFLALNLKSQISNIKYLLLIFLFLTTIWFTKSQSGIGATAVILTLVAIYLISSNLKSQTCPSGRRVSNIKWLTYILLPSAFILIFSRWSFVQKLSPLGPPNLQKLVEMDNANRVGGSDSMIIRQVVWQGARQLARQNPLLGTGVETFGYSYFTVRPAMHNLLSEWEFLYNKAHNEYLNLLANTGFFGLISYLLLIFTSIKLLRSKPSLLFGYISILITNYFGFSVVPIALFFFLYPAIALVLSDTKPVYLSLHLSLPKKISLSTLSLLTYAFLLTPYHLFTADLAYNRGRMYLTASAYKQSLEELKMAVTTRPDEPLFLAQLAEAQATTAIAVKTQLDTLPTNAPTRPAGQNLLFELETGATKNISNAISMNPHHINFHKSKAKIELYLGSFKPEYNQKALVTLLKLQEITPTDAKIAYNTGLLYEQLGDTKLAREQYRKALDLKPDYETAKQMLNQYQ